MKRKRKETCPSPILDESPKRTKVQAQRKFAQNSGVHSTILTPIRDLETADLPHTQVLPEPVELLPMKRPHTEDFLTFLCFRGTPILPQSLQFFNTASIVADGQVHEIKGDSSKNGPIDIAKCAGSSSEKPFIAFGVRKRADPIVISRQMDRKRRHALAIQALRRKYQEQKMAKIRALTISKLSEKTTNKTLVKTNTIQKTETVTKKNNTLQKTKVIATKHVKVTTETLKTKMKPRMCLRSFRGKFVQKELPFRPRRPEQETIRKTNFKKIARTSRNSNKSEETSTTIQKTVKKLPKISVKPKLETPRVVATSALKRQHLKRRIFLPNIVGTIIKPLVKPKLRSTTVKKSVISRKKAQQRVRTTVGKNSQEISGKSPTDLGKKENIKKSSPEKSNLKKSLSEENNSKSEPHQELPKRLTRKDAEVSNKNEETLANKNETKKEVTKNFEMKRQVKVAESAAKKTIQKNVNLKKEFNLKSANKDVKKNVAVQKNTESVSQENELGQKVTRDVKEMTVKKVVTRQSLEVGNGKATKVNENSKKTDDKASKAANKSKKKLKSDAKTKMPNTIKKQPKNVLKTVLKTDSPARNSPENEPIKRTTRESNNKAKTDILEAKCSKSEIKNFKANSKNNLLKKETSKTQLLSKESAALKNSDEKSKTQLLSSLQHGEEKIKTELFSKESAALKKSEETSKAQLVSKESAILKNNDVESKGKDINVRAKKELLISKEVCGDNKNKELKKEKSKAVKKEELLENIVEQKPYKVESINLEHKLVTNVEKLPSKNKSQASKPNTEAAVKKSNNFKEKSTRGVTLQKNTVDLLSKNPIKRPTTTKKDIIDECEKINALEQTLEFSPKNTIKSPITIEKDIADESKKSIKGANAQKRTNYLLPKDPIKTPTTTEKGFTDECEKSTREVDAQKMTIDLSPKNPIKNPCLIKKDIADESEEVDAQKKTNLAIKSPTTTKKDIADQSKKCTKEVTAQNKIIDLLLEYPIKCLTSTTKEIVDESKKSTKEATAQNKIIDLLPKNIIKSPTTTKHEIKDESKKFTKEVTAQNKTIDLLPINPIKSPSTTKKDIEESKKSTKEDVPMKISKASSPCRKESTSIKKEDNPKQRKLVGKKEESEQIISSRPSRKSKEAAAIYMEILSHKLVNESTIDDENGSIDSFPELPNVKKTERREIELKAQAKTCKEEGKFIIETPVTPTKTKPSSLDITLAELKKAKCPIELSTTHVFVATITDNEKSPKKRPEENPKTAKNKPTDEEPPKSSLGKRKSNPTTISSDDDSDNEVLQAKIRKSEAQKNLQQEQALKNVEDDESKVTKRQTRRTNQPAKETDSDPSDESFHIDVRVPRKKKVTRSRNKAPSSTPASVLEKNVDIILEAARVLENEKTLELNVVDDTDDDDRPLQELSTKDDLSQHKSEKSVAKELLKTEKPTSKEDKKVNKGQNDNNTDSDESTTSDMNLKSLQIKQRNKKLSKIKMSKSSVKSAASFSDSDEEPLAKLTSKNFNEKKPDKPKAKKAADKALSEVIMEPKPKRECTKRPSNYLAMLSSSDEDEPYFHGFKEEVDKPKVFVQAVAPSLDLLSKDMGRKGKVNMSNEQIEKWLKESALAGSSVAKENDAMLKFGEKIPTEIETVIPTSEPDTKPSECEEIKAIIAEPQPGCSKDSNEKPTKAEIKSPVTDRKWIFKKDKKELMPNKNAFSPENELSVYAFGEENEEVVSTPFRRPSRRPSSTATSRSEDELSKIEESAKQGQFRKPNPSDSEDSRCFNIPQNPTKITKIKSDSMVPPSNYHSKRQKSSLEPFDDYKYKIPSSPSASSGSSAKLYKKGAQKQKGKPWESINPVYVSDFPKPTDPAKLVEAPIFHPTEQEFQDPLEYIERIRHKAEQFGICKIIPPSSFKPECKVSDDMRFTAYNQYVHKMLHRWGPNFKEFIAIRKYLTTQSITLKTPPLIGGMEIDLPRLYQTVQSLGGLKEVIEKKKWSKVSDHMKIPKSAQDRVTKLDDIYCKYLLPYDTLSPAEREKLFDEVETYWAKKESRNLQIKTDPKQENKLDDISDQDYDSEDNEIEECTIKGKNMALNAFYRIARNTMSMYFKVTEPTALEVEQEFWRYVTQKQNHICVHSASIDCGSWGYGFAVSKNSPFAKHAWNLKTLSNNNGSVLRSLGPVIGVTIPTLHVGMVFSACCWYRDPHGLPWVEYLHTGGNKIWYGIPSSSCEIFHAAMQKLVPNYCRDKELWLPSDTAMVPPGMLMENNVSLCRTIQEPGQFIVVFPKVYTSSICTGYAVSESVYFAPLHWLRTARNLFNDLKSSCEPSMFSLDKLLVSIANDHRSSVDVLRVIVSFMEELCTNEKKYRIKLRSFGKFEEEKITNTEPPTKKKKVQSVDGDFECEICRTNLYVSMVIDTQEDLIYCLEDAIKLVEENNKIIERLKLKFALDETELDDLPKRIHLMIEGKLQKKVPSKCAGLPSMSK